MIDILLAVFIPLLMGVMIWILARNRAARKTKPVKVDHSTWRERAVWGWAMIVAADCAPVDAAGRARVTLTLEVHTPGTPAYTAAATWVVEQEGLAYVEVGKEISLKVDPLDLQYVYPNGSWAKVEE